MSAPRELRDTVARDLRPVKPLRSPSIRALALVPLAAAIVFAVPALQFFRSDMQALGVVRGWGLSYAQAVAGIIVVALALRESIPGRALSRGVVGWTIAGGLALPALVLMLTSSTFNIGPAPGRALVEGIGCFRASAAGSVPALIVAALLVARAFPLRPGIAGALYGLGCGLIADAGLRLFCEYTAPPHVAFAHGGAILGAMFAGVLMAKISAPRQ
jgi:negative regulator of sigma F NrsF-like protein